MFLCVFQWEEDQAWHLPGAVHPPCVYFYRESDVCFCVYFSEKKIKHDTYLVPYAHLELALMAMADGRDEDAKKLLHKARYVHKKTLH